MDASHVRQQLRRLDPLSSLKESDARIRWRRLEDHVGPEAQARSNHLCATREVCCPKSVMRSELEPMTEIHANPRNPARVDAAGLDWVPSPAAGVDRKRIERLGDEVARVTSVVRYAPDSRFPAHTHGGGEEYLVLDGTFSDEHGDQRPLTYVRNGVGSRHTPFTTPGCIILVKLWWMHPDETESTKVFASDPSTWTATDYGAQCRLHRGRYDEVDLIRVFGGQAHELPIPAGGAELFVVSGSLEVDGALTPAWTWLRAPDAGAWSLRAREEAVLYVKRGHLATPPPPPAG